MRDVIPPLKGVWPLLRDTATSWANDHPARRGAALAYYTVFSVAPILIITISIAALAFGEEAVRGEIVEEIGDLLGREAAGVLEALIRNAAERQAGVIGAVLGIGTLLIGATTVLAELKDDLDEIWRVPPRGRSGLSDFVRKRIVSFGVILSLGFLLLVSLVMSAALSALRRYLGLDDGLGLVLQTLNVLVSLGLVTLLFAMIYKLLPSARLAWRDVIVGALVTAILFTVGKTLIGLYLGNSAIASSYGAAGSLVVLLVWVYYSAQIFLFGAEFTRHFAHRYGSRRGTPVAQSASTA